MEQCTHPDFLRGFVSPEQEPQHPPAQEINPSSCCTPGNIHRDTSPPNHVASTLLEHPPLPTARNRIWLCMAWESWDCPKMGILCLLWLKILAGVPQPCYSLPALPPGARHRKGGTMHPWAPQSSPGRAHRAAVALGHSPSPGWSRSSGGRVWAEGYTEWCSSDFLRLIWNPRHAHICLIHWNNGILDPEVLA